MGEDNLSEGRAYKALRQIQIQSEQDDHKLLEGFFVGNEKDKDDFVKIEKAFEPMKNDINKDFLSVSMSYIDTKSIDSSWWIFSTIFVLFSFLFLE